MAKPYTKEDKTKFIEEAKSYVALIEELIAQVEKRIILFGVSSDLTELEIAELKVKKHELLVKLRINKNILEDFENDYNTIFLPQYEKRMEECFKNFDEYYKIIKENIKVIPMGNPLYLSIQAYDTENPDNADEAKMLLFYESIKYPVELIKKTKKK